MEEKLIYQGAESKIFLQENFVTSEIPLISECPENPDIRRVFVVKNRIKKSYRIPEIDEKLRKLRTRAEARIMEKLQDKINVPRIIKADENSKEIIMQFIEGKKLSDFLDNFPLEKQKEICQEIGRETGKMHNENIIHSDLTTSNMILVEQNPYKTNRSLAQTQHINPPSDKNSLSFTEENKIFFIDFGLSFHSSRIEDKAVDLHLFRQALESKHFEHWKTLFDKFLLAYNPKDKDKILLQLKKVEARGRYKSL